MTWERAGRVAWIAPVLAAAFAVAHRAILPPAEAKWVDVLFDLTFVAYATVGALIVSRLPRHPVGWLFCGLGVLSAGQGLLYAYGRRQDEPGASAAAGVDGWVVRETVQPVHVTLWLREDGR